MFSFLFVCLRTKGNNGKITLYTVFCDLTNLFHYLCLGFNLRLVYS
ncbi:conserved domain protein [Paraprevotella xylaniphila YIT 11841]|uniref:Conserved domain protein n=1 Tax=Paraprevotella xylaniphila YIT 11841 TaxID=762982 RepID=F3QX19_9BACT|nr:conserved domain protein [Paraprevotella xylaniphila YIT 11841]